MRIIIIRYHVEFDVSIPFPIRLHYILFAAFIRLAAQTERDDLCGRSLYIRTIIISYSIVRKRARRQGRVFREK